MDIIYSIAIITVAIGAIIRLIYKSVSGDGREVLEKLFERTEQGIKYAMIFLVATALTVLGKKITLGSAIITIVFAVLVTISINMFKETDNVTVKLIVYAVCLLIAGYLTLCAFFTWFLIGWGSENVNLIGVLF